MIKRGSFATRSLIFIGILLIVMPLGLNLMFGPSSGSMGNTTSLVFYILGAGMIILGLFLRKRSMS